MIKLYYIVVSKIVQLQWYYKRVARPKKENRQEVRKQKIYYVRSSLTVTGVVLLG